MKSIKRIVGIDPGSHHLGFGCIQKSGTEIKLLSAETIHAPKLALYERLESITPKLHALLDKLCPHEVAIEDTFYAKNVKSAFQLGIVRGIVFSACIARGIKVYEYAPTQVKSAVTGYGRADKSSVQKMVGLIVGQELKVGFDASDAVAIAICHASLMRFPQLSV